MSRIGAQIFWLCTPFVIYLYVCIKCLCVHFIGAEFHFYMSFRYIDLAWHFSVQQQYTIPIFKYRVYTCTHRTSTKIKMYWILYCKNSTVAMNCASYRIELCGKFSTFFNSSFSIMHLNKLYISKFNKVHWKLFIIPIQMGWFFFHAIEMNGNIVLD